MKKMVIMMALTISCLCVAAQTQVGKFSLIPQVGVSVVNTSSEHTRYKAGWSTGVTMEYQLTEPLSLSMGALFSMEGGKIKHSGNKLFLDYVNIPLLANYYVVKGLALKAGAQVGFQVYAKEKRGGDFVPIGFPKNKVSFAVPVGFSYEYAKLVLDVRYNIGLTDMLDVPEGSLRSKDFMITLGYKFIL